MVLAVKYSPPSRFNATLTQKRGYNKSKQNELNISQSIDNKEITKRINIF